MSGNASSSNFKIETNQEFLSAEELCKHPLPLALTQEPTDLDSIVHLADSLPGTCLENITQKSSALPQGSRTSVPSLNFLGKKTKSVTSLVDNLSPLRKNPSVDDVGSWFLHKNEASKDSDINNDIKGQPLKGLSSKLRHRFSVSSIGSKSSGKNTPRAQTDTIANDRSVSLDFVHQDSDETRSNSHSPLHSKSPSKGSHSPSLKASSESLLPISSRNVAFLESKNIIALEEQFLKLLKFTAVPQSVVLELQRRQEISGNATLQTQTDSTDFTRSKTSINPSSCSSAPGAASGMLLSASTENSSMQNLNSQPVLTAASSFFIAGNAGHLGMSYATVARSVTQNLRPSNESARSENSSCKANSREKMLKGYEQMLARIKHPNMGFKLKDHKKGLQVYQRSFAGSDLVTYLVKPPAAAKLNQFLNRDEALHYIKRLYELGYLCSYGLYEKFVGNSSLYTMQNSLLWVSHEWQPSDVDYACYLYRRQHKSTEKYHLEDFEEDVLRMKKKAIKADKLSLWLEVEARAKDICAFLKTLKDADRKLLQAWETFFWRLHRPPPGAVQQSLIRKYAETQEAEESYYAPIIATPSAVSPPVLGNPALSLLAQRFKNPADLLQYYERWIESYKYQANLNLLKVSQASKNMILRCEVLKFKDPFFNDDLYNKNPYVINSPAYWETERPQVYIEDLQLWAYTFTDLLSFSRGISVFRAFLQSELSHENLDFYLATRRLDQATCNYIEFRTRAQMVFDEFINDNAERLININSSIRSPIVKAFCQYPPPSKEDIASGKIIPLCDRLPDNIFHAAQSHIFELMNKDSYQRFLQSDFWKDVYASVINHSKTSHLAQVGLLEQLLNQPEREQSKMLLELEDFSSTTFDSGDTNVLTKIKTSLVEASKLKRNPSTAGKGKNSEKPPTSMSSNITEKFQL